MQDLAVPFLDPPLDRSLDQSLDPSLDPFLDPSLTYQFGQPVQTPTSQSGQLVQPLTYQPDQQVQRPTHQPFQPVQDPTYQSLQRVQTQQPVHQFSEQANSYQGIPELGPSTGLLSSSFYTPQYQDDSSSAPAANLPQGFPPLSKNDGKSPAGCPCGCGCKFDCACGCWLRLNPKNNPLGMINSVSSRPRTDDLPQDSSTGQGVLPKGRTL